MAFSPDSHDASGVCRYPDRMDASVLLAEDDRVIRESLERALRYEGFVVTTARDGHETYETVRAIRPDLLVLDVMMPGLDGLQVTHMLRSGGDKTPILLLTARAEITDRVAGLDAGADDYLVKPFALDELLARMRALLRRSGITDASEVLNVADLALDPAAHLAWRGERLLALTKTEFDLLELFMFNRGVVLTRDTIYERVWGFDFATTSNSIDVYVGYLRRKLEAAGEPRLIHTVRGLGYVLRPE